MGLFKKKEKTVRIFLINQCNKCKAKHPALEIEKTLSKEGHPVKIFLPEHHVYRCPQCNQLNKIKFTTVRMIMNERNSNEESESVSGTSRQVDPTSERNHNGDSKPNKT